MFKNPSFIFDIICTVVWLLLAVRYARKGFLAAVVQLTGNLVSLFGARQFSGWAAGQVFEQVFANSFRDQIAASISAEGAVSLSGIAAKYAGFLPESFRASIVEACERSISAVLNDNAGPFSMRCTKMMAGRFWHRMQTIVPPSVPPRYRNGLNKLNAL